jgi:hypothetical protein
VVYKTDRAKIIELGSSSPNPEVFSPVKRKNIILIALAVAILGLSLWWFTRPTAAVPKKIAEVGAPALSKVEAPHLRQNPTPRQSPPRNLSPRHLQTPMPIPKLS